MNRKPCTVICAAAVLLSFVVQSAAAPPTYRGRVLDRTTKQPIRGLVVEAQLQDEALPSGERIVGRTKTDANGGFTLQLKINRRDIALIVSEKGSTSKVINLGGQAHTIAEIERPLGIELKPSPSRENVIYTLVSEKKKK